MTKFFFVFSALLALIFNSHVSTCSCTIDPLSIVPAPAPPTKDCNSFINGMVDFIPFLSNEESQINELSCSVFKSAVSSDVGCICEMMRLENKKRLSTFRMLPTICRIKFPCDHVKISPAPSLVDAPAPHGPVSPVPSPAPKGESPTPFPLVPSPEPQSPAPTPSVPSPEHESPSPTPSVPSPEHQSPSPTPSVPSPKHQSPSPTPSAPGPKQQSPSVPNSKPQPVKSPKKHSSAPIAAQSNYLSLVVFLITIFFVYFH